ncbi:hypothetical protein ACHAQH_002158 [Verticillium albo-atrum]
MQLTQLLVSFASLLAVARATDVAICKNQDLGGGCFKSSIDPGFCWNVPGDYNDKMSSYVTNAPCTFFENGNCGGGSFVGNGIQFTVPANFNDKISSVRC